MIDYGDKSVFIDNYRHTINDKKNIDINRGIVHTCIFCSLSFKDSEFRGFLREGRGDSQWDYIVEFYR